MKSIKLNRFPCDQCGHNEDVQEDQKPKVIAVTISGNPYQICPDCLFKTEIWRKHVNEDDLRHKPVDILVEVEGDEDAAAKFNKQVNDLTVKTKSLTSGATGPRPKMEINYSGNGQD